MAFFLRRLTRALFSIVLIVSAIFFLMRMAGDPALAILGPDDFPAAILDDFRSRWGLDAPLFEQYRIFISHVVMGDFGRSFLDQRPALDIVLERLPKTLLLMLASLVITLGIGVPAGIIAALRQNSGSDAAVSVAAVVFQAMPNFVLGLCLIMVFSAWLKILPTSGSDEWQHLIMPALTFGSANAAVFSRFMRATTLDVLRQPYIIAAQARGIGWRQIVIRHVLPNTMLPMVTLLGFSIGGMVAGSIVVETIFAWPGVGRLTAMSVGDRDLAVVQVIVLLVMSAMVATNLVVDLLYAILDPRIRLQGGAK